MVPISLPMTFSVWFSVAKNAQIGRRLKRSVRGVGGEEQPKISPGDSCCCFASFLLVHCLKYKYDCGFLLHKKAIGTGFLQCCLHGALVEMLLKLI